MKNALIGAVAVLIAALITAFATMTSPLVSTHFPQKNVPAPAPTPTPASHANTLQGKNNAIRDQSNNNGVIFGDNNQGVQINQAHISAHPVTSDMDLKWNQDDFAEAVRQGNVPAIKEYLNSKDGFDPNTLWNGETFVLQLPIFQGTKNFPEILALFKETGKLNWNEVNDRSVFGSSYQHPITQQWSLLQEAADKSRLPDLKALIDAGADPSQLISDEISAFNAPPSGTVMYKGKLTGRTRDRAGAEAEQELANFKAIGYSLPHLEQALEGASRSPAVCAQEIRTHHSFKEAMEMAKKPQQVPSGQALESDPFQSVVSTLRDKMSYGPLAWQGDAVEYTRAIATACSPTGSF